VSGRVVGLDPSLAGFGVARVAHGRVVSAQRLAPMTRRGHERLEFLLDELLPLTTGADLVVIEGPSYGSPSESQVGHHERAGLWWLVTQQLWGDRIPYAVCAPGTRAKYATGNGRAGKARVLAAVNERWPLAQATKDDNIADALVMAAIGARYLGEPIEDGTQGRGLEAVRSLTFPGLLPRSGVAGVAS
jgi:crossover junction endodeoxyribonuclease RuvC